MSNSSFGFSPVIWTKPPSGIGAIWKIVPPRLKPTSVGPNPIEKRSTRIPHSRADQEVATLVKHDQQAEPDYRDERSATFAAG